MILFILLVNSSIVSAIAARRWNRCFCHYLTICRGSVTEAVTTPLCASETAKTLPLFGTYGSRSRGTSQNVDRSRVAEISWLQSCHDEGGTAHSVQAVWKPYRYLPGKLASRDINSVVAPRKKLDYACLCLVGKGFVSK